MKPNEKNLAINLRLTGMSFREIQTKVSVSKGTLSLWLRDVPLTEDQVFKLKHRRDAQHERIGQVVKRQREERWRSYEGAATVEWERLKSEPWFMYGLALYIGEGSKTHGSPGLSNCDPRVLRSILSFFFKLGIQESAVRVSVHLHDGSLSDSSRHYWSSKLELPVTQFTKPIIAVSRASKRLKPNYQLNGTCHVRFHSVMFMVKLRTWMDLALNSDFVGSVSVEQCPRTSINARPARPPGRLTSESQNQP
jgi:hypothetical protein